VIIGGVAAQAESSKAAAKASCFKAKLVG
jgi:hypothetical protein